MINNTIKFNRLKSLTYNCEELVAVKLKGLDAFEDPKIGGFLIGSLKILGCGVSLVASFPVWVGYASWIDASEICRLWNWSYHNFYKCHRFFWEKFLIYIKQNV